MELKLRQFQAQGRRIFWAEHPEPPPEAFTIRDQERMQRRVILRIQLQWAQLTIFHPNRWQMGV